MWDIVGTMKDTPEFEEITLLNTREVSARTGIPMQTLCNWRIRGIGIPYIKLGEGPKARVKYSVTDIREYVEQRRRYPSVRENMEADLGVSSKR